MAQNDQETVSEAIEGILLIIIIKLLALKRKKIFIISTSDGGLLDILLCTICCKIKNWDV